MLSSKRRRIQLRSDQKRRQSFEQRVCDDLCELVLSYLCIEDKIRLQCVSKQFRRLIAKKQLVLNIDYNSVEDKNSSNKLIELMDKTEDEEVFVVDCNRLATVLKTFQSINEINFGQKYKNREICIKNMDKVLQTVVDNCHQLSSFGLRCNSYELMASMVPMFSAKFGQHLKCIEFPDKYNYLYRFCRSLLNCPNLLTLNGIRFQNLIEDNEIMAKRLTQIHNIVVDSSNQLLFELFVRHFATKLKQLSIEFIPEDTDEEFYLMNSLSAFKSIEILSINSKLYNWNSCRHLVPCLQSIANNCQHLKSFSFNANIRESLIEISFNDCFLNFKALKRFQFMCFGLQSQEFSLSSLKNCRHLTHLKIGLTQLDDQFFDDIHIIAPKVVFLEIITETDLSDCALNPISRLKCLKHLTISRRPLKHSTLLITEWGLNLLINNSIKLETICFNNPIVCSDDRIDALNRNNSKHIRIDCNL